MVLVYRRSTGCRQYVFDTYTDFVKHFTKPCYEEEEFMVHEFDEEGREIRKFLTTTRDFIYGCGVQIDMFREVQH